MGGVADAVAADDVGSGCLDVGLSNSAARKSAQGCPRVGSRQLPRTAGISDSSSRMAGKERSVDGRSREYSLQCARSFAAPRLPKVNGSKDAVSRRPASLRTRSRFPPAVPTSSGYRFAPSYTPALPCCLLHDQQLATAQLCSHTIGATSAVACKPCLVRYKHRHATAVSLLLLLLRLYSLDVVPLPPRLHGRGIQAETTAGSSCLQRGGA